MHRALSHNFRFAFSIGHATYVILFVLPTPHTLPCEILDFALLFSVVLSTCVLCIRVPFSRDARWFFQARSIGRHGPLSLFWLMFELRSRVVER